MCTQHEKQGLLHVGRIIELIVQTIERLGIPFIEGLALEFLRPL